jgi:hypothetical protein
MLHMVKVGSLELYGLFQNHIFHQTKTKKRRKMKVKKV